MKYFASLNCTSRALIAVRSCFYWGWKHGRPKSRLDQGYERPGGGLGFSGKICGALTGGVCLLSLYTGRGKPEEEAHDRFLLMICELVDWFEDTIGHTHGGINCQDIIGEDLKTKTINPKCGNIVTATYERFGKYWS
jgi:C_GCAxxG_C_C family probable redox protein